MRISQVFGLAGTQASFDFIDVHVERDTALFIDPSSLLAINSPWADACTSGIQTFFQEVLTAIKSGKRADAMDLLQYLSEDDSTHLGYSGNSRGSGVGAGLASRFYKELSTSAAMASGLITDLEDTALLIEGVREDRISDVTTNIIREQLIEFTQDAASFYGIPLTHGIAVPPMWNRHTKAWETHPASLPMGPKGPLLLVPKSIVRRRLHLDPNEYYRHYVLEYFKSRELAQRSPLTYVVKGSLKIRKGDVERKYRDKYVDRSSIEKSVNVEGTAADPSLLDRYKRAKRSDPPRPIPSKDLSDVTHTSPLDLNALLAAVLAVKPGKKAAAEYEVAVEALMNGLFYPDLINPTRQDRLHDGRKIIDITYTNMGRNDFFHWLSQNFPAAHVVVECKNFSGKISNPEFDQLSGRFSPSRGQYGLLVYRGFADKAKALKRCKDTARDGRGYMTPLDDADLEALVQERRTTGSACGLNGLLHSRFLALNK